MNELDKLSDKYMREIIETYRTIEEELIYKVADMFAKYENLDNDYFIKILDEMNILDNETLEIIAEISGKPLNVIKDKLKSLGYSSIDTPTFNEAFKKDIIHINPNLIDYTPVMAYHIKQIERDIAYVQRQVKVGIYRDTYKAIKKAQMSVELGVKSPNQAIVEAVSDIARKGITSDTFLREGKEVHQGMESVVRRAVRTSFTNVMADMNEHLGKELDIDTWYMSQHLGARTTGTGHENHAWWQGKIYTTKELTTVCGLGTDRGYLGYNCRHLARPHIEGVSVIVPPLLPMKELERVYTLEQKQRGLERAIRTTKREIEAMKSLNSIEAEEHIVKLEKRKRSQQAKLRKFIKENSDVLKRDYSREKIYER